MGFGSLALGLVGAGVGGAAFGPTGAKVGFLVGSSIGSATSRSKIPNVEGPRLRDLKVQTSTYGVGIQRIYGRQITKGNVIWATPIKEIEHRSTVGSKAAKQEQITYTYELPGIAIGLCEGEISDILRVWVNDFLVYEAATDSDVVSGDPESLAYLNQQLAFYAKNVTYRIYKGTQTQTADPLIQSYEGIDNTPGYRNLAYIVIEDLPLDLFGNSVPEFTFEVVAKAKTFQTVNTSISYLQPTYKHLSTWTEAPVPGTSERAQASAIQTNLSLNSGQVIETYFDGYLGSPAIRRIAAASLFSRTKYNTASGDTPSGANILNVFPRYSVPNSIVAPSSLFTSGAGPIDYVDIHRIFDDKNETYAVYGTYYEIIESQTVEEGITNSIYGNPEDLSKISCCIYSPNVFYVLNIVRFNRLVSITAQKVRGIVKLGDKFIIADDSTGTGVYRFYFKTGVVWNGAVNSIVELDLIQGPIIGTASTFDVSMTSDGTFIYTIYRNMSTNTWVVQKWTSSLTIVSSFNLSILVPSATNEDNNRILAFNDGTIIVMNPYTLKAHTIEGMNTHVDTFDLMPVFIGGTSSLGDYPHWAILGHRDAVYVRRTLINSAGSPGHWDIYARVLETRTTTGTTLVPIHSLETTVADILKYAGYQDSDINVSGLSVVTNFKGYAIAKPGSTKSALEQLAAVYNFSLVEINGKIVATLQGREPIATIPKDEIGANDGSSSFDATLLDYTRTPDIDLPSKLRIQYQSDRPILTTSEQYAERLITDQQDTVNVEFSIILSDDEAAQVAEVLLHSAWASRQSVSFTTSRKFIRLNPNDNAIVSTPDGDFNIRITDREYGVPGLLIFSGYIESGNLTKSNAKGAKTPKIIFRPTSLLPTEISILDIPSVLEVENNYGVYYALSTSQLGWTGASIFANRGVGFNQISTSNKLSPIFQVSKLPIKHNPFSLDEDSLLILNPVSGDTVLQSITSLAQLYNYNLLLLINNNLVDSGAHNSYEILSFRDATLNIDGDYEVSGLVRGMFGTQKISSIGYTEPPISGYYTTVSSRKPVAYWRLGENSGLTAIDEIGNHDGIYVNSPTLGVAGLINDSSNTACRFLGTQNVVIPNTTTIKLTHTFSLEAWFTSTAQQNSFFIATWRQSDSTGHGIGLYLNNIRLIYNGGGALDINAPQIHDGLRHHVVATYTSVNFAFGVDNVIARLYLDGVLVGTTGIVGLSNNTTNCCIGSAGDSTLKYVGVIDEVAIYGRVLSSIEVFENYRSGVKGTTLVATNYYELILSDSPVGYWRLGEALGYVAVDQIAGHNGVIPNNNVIYSTPGAIINDPDTALTFAGVPIEISNTGSIQLNSNFSAECWVRYTDISNNTAIFGTYGITSGQGWGVGVSIAAGPSYIPYLVMNSDNFVYDSVSPASINDNVWHQLVVTFTGSSPNITGRLYLDGSLIATGVSDGSITNTSLLHIGDVDGGGNFNGSVDEASVYNYVLTPEQITEHYQAGITGIADPLLDGASTSAYLLVDHTGMSTRSGRIVESSIGALSGDYKAVTFGLSPSTPSPIDNLLAKGWSHRPYPVANPSISGPESGAGTYIVSWKETSRINQGWEDGFETAVDPQIDAYIIQVVNMVNEGIAIRSTTITTNSLSSYTYTSTQYAEDFGTAAVALGFRIFAVIAGRAGNGILASSYLYRPKFINYI